MLVLWAVTEADREAVVQAHHPQVPAPIVRQQRPDVRRQRLARGRRAEQLEAPRRRARVRRAEDVSERLLVDDQALGHGAVEGHRLGLLGALVVLPVRHAQVLPLDEHREPLLQPLGAQAMAHAREVPEACREAAGSQHHMDVFTPVGRQLRAHQRRQRLARGRRRQQARGRRGPGGAPLGDRQQCVGELLLVGEQGLDHLAVARHRDGVLRGEVALEVGEVEALPVDEHRGLFVQPPGAQDVGVARRVVEAHSKAVVDPRHPCARVGSIGQQRAHLHRQRLARRWLGEQVEALVGYEGFLLVARSRGRGLQVPGEKILAGQQGLGGRLVACHHGRVGGGGRVLEVGQAEAAPTAKRMEPFTKPSGPQSVLHAHGVPESHCEATGGQHHLGVPAPVDRQQRPHHRRQRLVCGRLGEQLQTPVRGANRRRGLEIPGELVFVREQGLGQCPQCRHGGVRGRLVVLQVRDVEAMPLHKRREFLFYPLGLQFMLQARGVAEAHREAAGGQHRLDVLAPVGRQLRAHQRCERFARRRRRQEAEACFAGLCSKDKEVLGELVLVGAKGLGQLAVARHGDGVRGPLLSLPIREVEAAPPHQHRGLRVLLLSPQHVSCARVVAEPHSEPIVRQHHLGVRSYQRAHPRRQRLARGRLGEQVEPVARIADTHGEQGPGDLIFVGDQGFGRLAVARHDGGGLGRRVALEVREIEAASLHQRRGVGLLPLGAQYMLASRGITESHREAVMHPHHPGALAPVGGQQRAHPRCQRLVGQRRSEQCFWKRTAGWRGGFHEQRRYHCD